jgi:hypothetical protein
MDTVFLDAVIGVGTAVRPAIMALVIIGLWLGAQRAGLPEPERQRTVLAVAVPLVLWFIAADLAGRTGVLTPLAEPAIGGLPLAVAVPLAIGVTYVVRSRRLAAILDAMPLSWLVGLQVYRVAGLVFLAQWAGGMAPAAFAFPAGLGDFLTGLLALPAAFALARGGADAKRKAVLWNLFGIADFVVALSLGVMTAPGPLQALAFDNPNRLTYPLVLIPAFAVPLSLMLHVVSLRQIARRLSRGGAARDGEVRGALAQAGGAR